jgi:hypothetical protein
MDTTKQKIFGVGFSKTGTTSLESALNLLGYKTWHGHWQNPNMSYIMSLYLHRDYQELFKIVNYYDAFSDAPWGGGDLYQELYARMPKAYFILTLRPADDWYQSLERMLTKFSPDNDVEYAFDTFHKNGRYGIVHFFEKVFGVTTLKGNRSKIIEVYKQYNHDVIDFFSNKDAKFLILQLSDENKWKKICTFLNKPIPPEQFPHQNSSSNVIPNGTFSTNVKVESESEKTRGIRKNERKTIEKQKLMKKPFGLTLKRLYDWILIKKSSYFSADWYLNKYSDVAQSRIPPAWHYLVYGGFEGRDPGPEFNSLWYMETYQDVRQAGVNPLVHYLKHGREEGRFTCEELRQQKSHNTTLTPKAGSLFFEEKGRPKVFCIGMNKTGTTSLAQALSELGYSVGHQLDAEKLMDDWVLRDFRRLIQYCQTADAFQDVPFSLDFTYQILDFAFPQSKFILTVRNNADEWYKSLTRFHANLLGINRIPTVKDLKEFVYIEKGYLWKHQVSIFGVDEETLYDEKIYKRYYERRNADIKEYFRYRPQDLLVLNLSDRFAMHSLCDFLGIEYRNQTMPHLNKSF